MGLIPTPPTITPPEPPIDVFITSYPLKPSNNEIHQTHNQSELLDQYNGDNTPEKSICVTKLTDSRSSMKQSITDYYSPK